MVLNGGGAKILGASTGRLKITKREKQKATPGPGSYDVVDVNMTKKKEATIVMGRITKFFSAR